MQYRVINLDVWGNEDDGFEVNDLHNTGLVVDLADDADDASIVSALIEVDALQDYVTGADVDISGEPEFTLFVDDATNSMPLFHLQAIED